MKLRVIVGVDMRRPVGPISARPREIRGVWCGLEWVLWWSGRYRGATSLRWFIRRPGEAPRGLTADELGETMPALPQPSTAASPLVGAQKSTLMLKVPELQSWLCDAAYPDGKPIGATQLSIRRRGSTVYATLKIADQGGLKVEVAEPSIDRAFVALEALLTGSPVPWQPDPYPLDAAGKKKK